MDMTFCTCGLRIAHGLKLCYWCESCQSDIAREERRILRLMTSDGRKEHRREYQRRYKQTHKEQIAAQERRRYWRRKEARCTTMGPCGG